MTCAALIVDPVAIPSAAFAGTGAACVVPELEAERRRVRAALLQELADLARPEPLVIEHNGHGR